MQLKTVNMKNVKHSKGDIGIHRNENWTVFFVFQAETTWEIDGV